MFLEDLVTSKY